MKKLSGFLTVADVAAALELGLSTARGLIAKHKSAARIGRALVLPEAALPDLRQRPKPGRRWPSKNGKRKRRLAAQRATA